MGEGRVGATNHPRTPPRGETRRFTTKTRRTQRRPTPWSRGVAVSPRQRRAAREHHVAQREQVHGVATQAAPSCPSCLCGEPLAAIPQRRRSSWRPGPPPCPPPSRRDGGGLFEPAPVVAQRARHHG